MKIQEQTIRLNAQDYRQPWITLPTKLVKDLGWQIGTEIKISIEKGGLMLRKK